MYDTTRTVFKLLKKCNRGVPLKKLTTNETLCIDFLKKPEKLKIGYLSNFYMPRQEPSFKKNVLDMVWLCVTENCNYRCVHCYENSCPLVEKKQSIYK